MCTTINQFLAPIGFQSQHKLKVKAKVKGYLRYKTITSQHVSSETQVKNFFKICSVFKILKFLYF